MAARSIGRIAGNNGAEAALANLLVQYELISGQLETVEQLMYELLLKVPHAGNLLAIKGIGIVTAAIIISEIGDIKRFQDSRQILKIGTTMP